MKKSVMTILGAAVAALACATGSAFGQGINIDFEIAQAAGGPGAGLPDNAFGAAANQPGVWNRVFQNQDPVSLTDVEGNGGVAVMNRLGPLPHSAFNNANTTDNWERLMDDFWTTDNVPADMIFRGLNAGWYEVYTYAINPAGSGFRTQVEVQNAVTPSIQQAGGTMPFNNFLLGRTHTKHRVFIGVEEDLKIRISNASGGFTAVGGIQIKPVAPCPEVDITDPSNFACICETQQIKGDVTIAAPGNIAFWYTEYRSLSDLDWTLVDFGFFGGVGINLGTFNTAGLSEGFYFIKTTAFSGDSCFDEDTHIVYVDKSFQTLQMTAPATNGVYGGVVCVGGLVDDRCLDRYSVQWAPLPAGAPFQDVQPGTPFYFGSFPIVGVWTTWNTITAGVPDGEYVIRTIARDRCGFTASDNARFIVDNTAPAAKITSPTNCEFVGCELVRIVGTACDTNLAGWVVQVTGGPYNNWVTIASGNTCIIDDTLAVWDTTGLPFCGYTIRLIVTDSSIQNCNSAITNQSEFSVSVNVGLRGDVNGDGQVGFPDITAVLQRFGMTCPMP